jgi:hypothetical protein
VTPFDVSISRDHVDGTQGTKENERSDYATHQFKRVQVSTGPFVPGPVTDGVKRDKTNVTYNVNEDPILTILLLERYRTERMKVWRNLEDAQEPLILPNQ